jgi:hypothetical protein
LETIACSSLLGVVLQVDRMLQGCMKDPLLGLGRRLPQNRANACGDRLLGRCKGQPVPEDGPGCWCQHRRRGRLSEVRRKWTEPGGCEPRRPCRRLADSAESDLGQCSRSATFMFPTGFSLRYHSDATVSIGGVDMPASQGNDPDIDLCAAERGTAPGGIWVITAGNRRLSAPRGHRRCPAAPAVSWAGPGSVSQCVETQGLWGASDHGWLRYHDDRCRREALGHGSDISGACTHEDPSSFSLRGRCPVATNRALARSTLDF